nr:hypothetical protein [Pyramidobacter piscolens]
MGIDAHQLGVAEQDRVVFRHVGHFALDLRTGLGALVALRFPQHRVVIVGVGFDQLYFEDVGAGLLLDGAGDVARIAPPRIENDQRLSLRRFRRRGQRPESRQRGQTDYQRVQISHVKISFRYDISAVKAFSHDFAFVGLL